MSWLKVIVWTLGFLQCAVSEPAVVLLERFIRQAFQKPEHVDTLILWGVSNPSVTSIKSLPYPKIVFDQSAGLGRTPRENRLIIMEFEETDKHDIGDLLNTAFAQSNKHYQAKFVILLELDNSLLKKLAAIRYFFNFVHIVHYVLVLHHSGHNRVVQIGYVEGNQFLNIPLTAEFGTIFNGRLRNRPLRTFVTQSKPYTYQMSRWKLEGLDVEIGNVIARMMDMRLFITLIDTVEVRTIQDLLYNRTMDIYLTRRACNRDLKLPQVNLQERSTIRLMMPKSQMVNFNLQFLKPYKPEVWYLLSVVLVVSYILNGIFREKVTVNVMLVVFFGHQRETNGLSAILVVAVLVLKFILLEAYLGQVTSFMIRLRYQANPQTLEQFFDSDVLLNVPAVMNHFINQLPGELPARLGGKIRDPQVFDQNPSFEPGYAYIINDYASETLDDELAHESPFDSTGFYIMDEPLQELKMCYMFAMWSEVAAEFRSCLERLYDTGIIAKLTRDAWRLARALKPYSSTLLMFPDLVPVFFFLCYGWTLSGLVFGLEVSLPLVKRLLMKWRF